MGTQDARGTPSNTHTTHWLDHSGGVQYNVNTYTVTGLSNGTTYRVRVNAISDNPFGESVWVEASGTPRALAAPGGIDVSKHPTSTTSLSVRWDPVEGATAYEAEWRLASDASAVGSNTNIDRRAGANHIPFNITGLTSGTAYEVRVRAKNADGGTWSSWYTGTPGTDAAVTWSATLSTGSNAGNVGCFLGNLCSSALSPNTITVGGTTFTITRMRVTPFNGNLTVDVTPNSNAALRALQFCSGPVALSIGSGGRVINQDGTGLEWEPNTQVEVRIGSNCAVGASTPPSAPRNLRVVVGNGELSVGWLAPSRGILTGFELEWKRSTAPDRAATTANDPRTGWVSRSLDAGSVFGNIIRNLATGVVYDVRVRATSAVGDGAWAQVQATLPEIPLEAPRLDGLTLSAGGTPLTLIQGLIHADQGGDGTTGFARETQRYMAVVPYGTSAVTLTPTWTAVGAFGQVASVRPQRHSYVPGQGSAVRPVFTDAQQALTPAQAIESGSSVTLNLAPSMEGGRKLELWERHTEVLVRVYRNHPYLRHTKLEYTYSVLVVQGGPIPVSLSLTPDTIPYEGTATLTVSIPVPLPMDRIIPLTVTYGEIEPRDVLFRPNPDHPNAYYGLDRPVDILMRRGETEASIQIVAQPDTGRTATENFYITLDTDNFPPGSTRGYGAPDVKAVEVAPWTLTGDPNKSRAFVALAADSNQRVPRVGGIPGRYIELIQKIQEWRDDPRYVSNKAHTDRWDRVLVAFGVPVSDSSLTAMGAAEAQTYADRGWTRWVEVAEALREWEAGDPAVTVAGGEAVTEGGAAGFTLTLSHAPFADLAVAVSVADVSGRGAFASAPGTRTVTVPAGSTSAAFTVATVDDSEDEADGWVVATLAAGRGYTLGDAARAEVAVADNDEGLPELVTRGSTAREGTDAAAVFTVRLARAAPHAVTVDWATADGAGPAWTGQRPATAGADYTATSGTLTFAAGQRFGSVRVPILDDAVDEGMEYFLVRFSNPQGAVLPARYREAVGFIRNDDPLQRMWLSRFGRAVSEQVLDAVSARTGGRAAPARVTLGGHEVALDAAWPAEGALPGSGAREDDFARLMRGEDAQAPSVREVSMTDLLLASSFHMASAAEADASTGRWSLWGRGARSSFSGARDALSLDGDVTTATLGFDYERARWLVGVAFSRSSGDGSWKAGGTCDTGCAGELESTLTGVWPYARYRVSDTFSVWGAAGFGAGEMTLTPGGASSMDADVEMGMAAAGARGVVVPARAPGGFELALRADFLLTDTRSDAAAGLAETEAETSRVRLLLEGSRSFKMGAAVLTPSVEMGFRNDSGDAERGSGLEVGGGVRWASGGLTTEVRVRGLLAHSDSGYEEWGVSASVGYAPGTEGRGLTLRAGSAWGASRSGAERLWSQAAGLAPAGAFEPGPASFEAEVGYGVGAWGGLLTPYTGVAVTGSGETYRAGGRFRLAEDLTMSLEGDLRENATGAVHGVALRGTMRW